MMPTEANKEDCGWRAGPVERELPRFNPAHPPGPTNANLKYDDEVAIMNELITPELITPECKDKAVTNSWISISKDHHPTHTQTSSLP